MLVDTGLSDAELDAAEASFDRCCADDGSRPGARVERCADSGYCAVLANPWFEHVASQVLRSERVHLVENLPHHRPPAASAAAGAAAKMAFDAERAWTNGCHIDWQVSTDDFEATPRRDMCAIWLWLSDVTPDTAAMRVLPRSHLPIQRHWQNVLTREHRQQLLPRNYGLFPHPSKDYPTFPQYIPEPEDFRFSTAKPLAVEARRGQALVFTQSMLHTGWSNFTTSARKAIIVSWVAAGVPFGVGSPDGLSAQLELLRASLVKWQSLYPSSTAIAATKAGARRRSCREKLRSCEVVINKFRLRCYESL